MKRSSTANWKGTGKEGSGTLSAPSGIFTNYPYTSDSRFAQGVGTNPEELIAAAHAGCFTMKLGYVLAAAGFTPDNIDTTCTITIESGVITESHLEVEAKVPDIDADKFIECANEARLNCPVSKALNTNITMSASLANV